MSVCALRRLILLPLLLLLVLLLLLLLLPSSPPQLDMDAMSDYQTEMLLKMLQLREQFSATYDSEGEALQLQLLLPAKGSSRRPHFMDTDAG
jgi:hypothetical protein